jgi:hypothetical protein
MNASGLVVRTWNDAPISRRDGDGFADATAMCRANGKDLFDYQRLERTAAYIAALGESLNLPADQLVLTTTSGPNHLRGTWIHPRLAVDLARWLSPQFAVWMDGWFLEAAGQAQEPAPAVGPKDFREMTWDEWMAQPLRLRQAQRCVWHEEQLIAGVFQHDNVSVGQWFVDNPPITQISTETAKQISSMVVKQLNRSNTSPAPTRAEDLTPLSGWILEAIRRRRSAGLPARTRDLADMSDLEWSYSSVSNRLTLLRRQALVTKQHLGWHLTHAAEQLLAPAA